MRVITTLLSGLLCAGLCAVNAGADMGAGKAAYASCIACHGSAGEGNAALNSPVLAGLDAAYLARQLNNFKSGLRGSDPADTLGAQMRAMAMTLGSDQAVADVAAYVAQMPPLAVSGEQPAAADLRNGDNQYNGACGACHGGKAQGNVLLHAPRLAGQHTAYLRRQYQNFAAGIRGAHPDDRLGRQMKMMATVLTSDKDLEDVLAFIQASGG